MAGVGEFVSVAPIAGGKTGVSLSVAANSRKSVAVSHQFVLAPSEESQVEELTFKDPVAQRAAALARMYPNALIQFIPSRKPAPHAHLEIATKSDSKVSSLSDSAQGVLSRRENSRMDTYRPEELSPYNYPTNLCPPSLRPGLCSLCGNQVISSHTGDYDIRKVERYYEEGPRSCLQERTCASHRKKVPNPLLGHLSRTQ